MRIFTIGLIIPGAIAGTLIAAAVLVSAPGRTPAEAETRTADDAQTAENEAAAVPDSAAAAAASEPAQTDAGETEASAAIPEQSPTEQKWDLPDSDTAWQWVSANANRYSDTQLLTARDNADYAKLLYREANGLYELTPADAIELTEDEKSADLPLFEQWDDRWGYEPYGDGIIGTSGCGPTCMAMVAEGLLRDPSINPATVAAFSDSHKLYAYGTGTRWALFQKYSDSAGITCRDLKNSEALIKSELGKKRPVICSVRKGNFTYGGHFIVLTSIDMEGNVTVNDPMSRDRSSIKWELSTIMDQIKNAWSFHV